MDSVPTPKLPDLTPSQVVELKDALLSNADSLLTGAIVLLEAGNVALARSLAILGLEESGKAIAIHQRQVKIAYSSEGAPFVDGHLAKTWGDHGGKLKLVHEFLVDELYWFDSEPPDREENLGYLGQIDEWARNHNVLKQRGFYVDVTDEGNVLSPADLVEVDAMRELIGRVHQIGWQLRLGEHIEAKGQAEMERDTPAASVEEVEDMRSSLGSLDADMVEDVLLSMRTPTLGQKLNNREYRLLMPPLDSAPFRNVGQPGYEAESRELARLAREAADGRRGNP